MARLFQLEGCCKTGKPSPEDDDVFWLALQLKPAALSGD
jgi:hypothetical protein